MFSRSILGSIAKLAILVFCVATSWAADQSTTPQAGSTSNVVQATKPTASLEVKPGPSAEVLVLRAQVTELTRFQDGILTTVWGALGVVAVVAAFLVGYSWFSGQRAYERDRQALTNQIEARFEELRTQSDKYAIQQSEKVEKLIAAKAAEAARTAKAAFEREVADLNERLRDLELEAIKAEYSSLKQTGLLGSAMMRASSYIELCLDGASLYELDEGLSLMADIIGVTEKRQESEDWRADPGIVEGANEVLSRCKDRAVVAGKLRDRLLALRV